MQPYWLAVQRKPPDHLRRAQWLVCPTAALRTTTTDASQQNNTGPLGWPVKMDYERVIQLLLQDFYSIYPAMVPCRMLMAPTSAEAPRLGTVDLKILKYSKLIKKTPRVLTDSIRTSVHNQPA